MSYNYFVRQRGFVLLPVLIILILVSAVGYVSYQNIQLRKGDVDTLLPITTKFPDSSIKHPTDIPYPSPVSKNYYNIGNYSFTIPVGFKIKDENLNREIGKNVVITNTNGASFELVINEGGRGVEFADSISDKLIKLGGRDVQRIVFQGTGPSEVCPECDNKSEFNVWIILENYKPPKEGVKDMIWYTFNTNKVGYNKAMDNLNQILSTFKFTE